MAKIIINNHHSDMIKENISTKTRSSASQLLVLIEKRKDISKQMNQCDWEIWESIKQVRYAFPKGSKAYMVFKARYADHKTLEQIAKEYGVTRERIRQIEEKVLKELQSISF